MNLFKKLNINGIIFSIDAASKATYEKIRIGACWEEVIGNLKKLIRYRETTKVKFDIGVSFTVMSSNFTEIPRAIDLFEPLGVTLHFHPVRLDLVHPEFIFNKSERRGEFMKVIKRSKMKTSQPGVLNSLEILHKILMDDFVSEMIQTSHLDAGAGKRNLYKYRYSQNAVSKSDES